MPSRKIEDLTPAMQEKAKLFAAKMAKAGIPFKFTSTSRTQAEQDTLYEQGRSTAGMVVTWTRKSKHIEGTAFDIAILKDGKPVWDVKVSVDGDNIPDYEEAAAIGEACGLIAGARFKNKDYPHFELKETA
jgi:peptidoglycan L-alanyl-D-glutamate endopeptidase CwlK